MMLPNILPHIFAAPCAGGDFLGFPKWYKYLNGAIDPRTGFCTPSLENLSDVWLVVAAIIEILLRLAALAAIVFVIWGGIQYVLSQGDPAKTAQARSTIINALVGLIIAIGAISGLTFVAGRFT